MPTNLRVILINSTANEFQSEMPLGVMTVGTILKSDYGLAPEIWHLPADTTAPEEFVEFLRIDARTAFIGLSTMCNTLPRTLTIARTIKQSHPSLPVILGGPQASSVPGELIQAYDFIDGIVIGEAERVIPTLWEALCTRRRAVEPGLYYVPPGMSRISLLPLQLEPAQLIEVDEMRALDYTLVPQDPQNPDRLVSVEIGRGCPYKCTFCSTKVFFQRRFRFRSSNAIVQELQNIKEHHPASCLEFVHDMFTTNRRLVEQLCRHILDERLDVDWGCSARTDRIDDDLLDLMVTAGCRRIFFGVESGSENIQRDIRKGLSIDGIWEAVRAAWQRGIGVTASLIIGFPSETYDDLAETLNMYFEFRSWRPAIRSVQVQLLTPLAGTELTSQYRTELTYDGSLDDVTIRAALTEWEDKQVRNHPAIFSSFYHFQNVNIPHWHYRYIYRLICQLEPFGNTLRLLREYTGDAFGTALIEWTLQRSASETLPNYFDPRVHVPLAYDSLRSFIERLTVGDDCMEILTSVLEFERWVAVELPQHPGSTFVSPLKLDDLDTQSLSSIRAAPMGSWLYAADRQTRVVRRMNLARFAASGKLSP